ncbi:hypothetical protein RDI58_027993 [Solanum bulbocastanum]|uniref:UDP-glucuronate decarboxylase n=1 Tax=Solanum bulbocastanum TaxID=147425 RepID=A0AAN8SQI9_SOLBU
MRSDDNHEVIHKNNIKKHSMMKRFSFRNSILYVLEKQRFMCLLIGIATSIIICSVVSMSSPIFKSDFETINIQDTFISSNPIPRRIAYELVDETDHVNAGGKVPLGLKGKSKRILVTGGAGFVGSHLVDRLIARGDSVIVVDNFFTAKRVGARFLITSTSEVYGDPLQHPQAETYWGNVNPIGVRSCYDEGKRTAETLTMDYHRGLNIEVRIARIFNTYGPRMCIDDGRVVSNFVAQALRKEPMTVYGDGKQTRSFQFVSDLVVQETIDPNAKIEFRPNTEDDPHKRKPDITKAKQLLGWEPAVSLRQGLPMMVDDFRQRIFGDDKQDSGNLLTI